MRIGIPRGITTGLAAAALLGTVLTGANPALAAVTDKGKPTPRPTTTPTPPRTAQDS